MSSESNGTLQGKVCVVTGATSGIGKATAQGLANAGATVVLVCRDRGRGEATAAEIAAQTGNRPDLVLGDLAELAQVRVVAAELKSRYPAIHVLINNAGVMLESRQLSPDGHELQFAVNHLAPFLLTQLLKEPLVAGAPSRVINVASQVHTSGSMDFEDLGWRAKYSMFKAYGRSKLANIMFTYDLAERWRDLGITVNALHPGVIATNLGGMPKFMKLFLPKAEKGARTSLYLATSADVAGVTGKYFKNCKEAKSSAESHDRGIRQRLWKITTELVDLELEAAA